MGTKEISTWPPLALKLSRIAIDQGLHSSFEQTLELEAGHLLACVAAQNQSQFVESKLQKMKQTKWSNSGFKTAQKRDRLYSSLNALRKKKRLGYPFRFIRKNFSKPQYVFFYNHLYRNSLFQNIMMESGI